MKFYSLFLFKIVSQLYVFDYVFCQRMPNLNCLEFDDTCAWHNCQTPAAPLMWFRTSANISRDQMMTTTGTAVMPSSKFFIKKGWIISDYPTISGQGRMPNPNGSYAIASSNSVNQSLHACLISDVVPSLPSNGSLMFSYWTSPFVILNVCQKIDQIPFNLTTMCQQTPLVQGPGPANVTIGASTSPFQIIIRASNFVFSNGALQGGFAIVDSIQYSNGPMPNTTTTPGNATASTNSTITAGNSTLATGNAITINANSTNSTTQTQQGMAAANGLNNQSVLVSAAAGNKTSPQIGLLSVSNSTNSSTTASSSTG